MRSFRLIFVKRSIPTLLRTTCAPQNIHVRPTVQSVIVCGKFSFSGAFVVTPMSITYVVGRVCTLSSLTSKYSLSFSGLFDITTPLLWLLKPTRNAVSLYLDAWTSKYVLEMLFIQLIRPLNHLLSHSHPAEHWSNVTSDTWSAHVLCGIFIDNSINDVSMKTPWCLSKIQWSTMPCFPETLPLTVWLKRIDRDVRLCAYTNVYGGPRVYVSHFAIRMHFSASKWTFLQDHGVW